MSQPGGTMQEEQPKEPTGPEVCAADAARQTDIADANMCASDVLYLGHLDAPKRT